MRLTIAVASVLFDVMGEVSVCELLAQEYPDINFIIPHLGSSDDWKAQVTLIDHLVRPPISIPTHLACDASTCCRMLCVGQAQARSCSVPTDPG
jgi:hypothetical protein